MKILAMSLLIFSFVGQTVLAHTPGFQVVVHPSNPVSSTDRKFLADIFLKKKIYWPDLKVIMVVDLTSTSNVREYFSEKILNRRVPAVRNYWQQLLFSGRGLPPPELKTEQDVLNFVENHPEAIGYISDLTNPGPLKVLKIK